MGFFDTILQSLLTWFIQNSSFAGVFILAVGILRIVFKPIVAMITAIIAITPSKNDDSAWAKIQASDGWKYFVFIIDWLTSIKLPVKK